MTQTCQEADAQIPVVAAVMANQAPLLRILMSLHQSF